MHSPNPGPVMGNEHTSTLSIEGMTCNHCADHVVKEPIKIPGINAARADAPQNLAWAVADNTNPRALGRAIEEAGYKFKGFAS